MPWAPLVVKKGSKSRWRTASGMPTPVSATASSAASGGALPDAPWIGRTATVTCPVSGQGVDGIEQEIDQHFAERRRIAQHRRGVDQVELYRDGAPFALRLVLPAGAGQLDRLARHRTKIDGLKVAGVDRAGVLAHAGDGGRAVPRGPLNGLDTLPLLAVAYLPQQHFGPSQDSGQQVVEVVGNPHGQLAGGSQSLRPDQQGRLTRALDGDGGGGGKPIARVSSSAPKRPARGSVA